jgi:hypothetical protein
MTVGGAAIQRRVTSSIVTKLGDCRKSRIANAESFSALSFDLGHSMARRLCVQNAESVAVRGTCDWAKPSNVRLLNVRRDSFPTRPAFQTQSQILISTLSVPCSHG